MGIVRRYHLGKQDDTRQVQYFLKESALSPKLAHQLMDLGVDIHTERTDDWFWDTFKDNQ